MFHVIILAHVLQIPFIKLSELLIQLTEIYPNKIFNIKDNTNNVINILVKQIIFIKNNKRLLI